MFQNSYRLIGTILLISGCCIGAGMLGLPLVTASAGFIPSSLCFIICWGFMAATGLLVLEANLWFDEGVHLMTIAELTLGKTAKAFVGLCFSFLFYCLLVAYLAGGGNLLAEFCSYLFGITISSFFGSLILILIFGGVVFMGTAQVDWFNRFLMLGLCLSYGVLVLIGIPHIESLYLISTLNWEYALPALPTMIISFGYHNLIPSLTTYLKKDASKIRISILLGSLIPLMIYLVWVAIILGMLSPQDFQSGAMVTKIFKEAIGSAYVVNLMHIFAFFAIVTSFLGVALSFVDFLADGLKIKKNYTGSSLLICMVLIPPCLFAYLYPDIFLTALNYAGAFGAVLLFGVIPVLMVWKGRYQEKRLGVVLIPGGKISLIAIGVFAIFIFLMQLKIELDI